MSESERETRQLGVVKKPAADASGVLYKTDGDPLMIVGESENPGPMRYVCGGCRAVLADGVFPGQLIALTLQCAACGCYNRTLD